MRYSIVGLLVVLVLIGSAGTGLAAPNFAPDDSSLAPTQKVIEAEWKLDTPVVDGDLSDWANYERHVLDNTTASAPASAERPDPADLSGWASMMWGQDDLFIALYVVDDNVVRNSRNWHFDDMAAFTFDVDNDDILSPPDIRLTLSPNGTVTINGGWPLGMNRVCQHHAEGWLCELSMPLRELGEDLLSDAHVGFTWGLQDDDGSGVQGYLVWEGSTFLVPTAEQGDLFFINGPTREWITIRPGVDGYDGIEDATLDSWYPDQNDGADPEISIRGVNAWHLAMKIDLPDLPHGARVLGGNLHINFKWRNRDWKTEVYAYRLLKPWDENSMTWYTTDSANRWTLPGANSIGADRDNIVLDSVVLDAVPQDYVWDISSYLVDVFENPGNNHGLIFRPEGGQTVEFKLDASECGPTCAPWVELYIELPPPSS